ncbi:MAG: hypothetical protein Q4F27_04910, partial [Desulfovibrionaceae bacterium]|nr:hypothetical protein [Desulfovibrionaceae bacterium]
MNAPVNVPFDTPLDGSDSRCSALARLRSVQQYSGLCSALILLAAVLAMLDGLQAVVRGSAYRLDMIPGESRSLSGPCPAVTPAPSDLLVQIGPQGAPLHFHFEDFFASYWTGTGMWRGSLVAGQTADRQQCT